MDSFEERVRACDWASEPRSEWHAPENVPAALMRAWRGDAATCRVLMDALAHDHAGSWYPVLLPAMPFLHGVLRHAPPDGASGVLALLGDLAGCFDADPETAHDVHRHELAFRDGLRALCPTVKTLAAHGGDVAGLATEVATDIEERLADDRRLAQAR